MQKQSVVTKQFRCVSASAGIAVRSLAYKKLSVGSNTAYFIKLSFKKFSSL